MRPGLLAHHRKTPALPLAVEVRDRHARVRRILRVVMGQFLISSPPTSTEA